MRKIFSFVLVLGLCQIAFAETNLDSGSNLRVRELTTPVHETPDVNPQEEQEDAMWDRAEHTRNSAVTAAISGAAAVLVGAAMAKNTGGHLGGRSLMEGPRLWFL